MSTVMFSSMRLRDTTKRGIVKPNSDGYYTMVVGGLNMHNSSGHFYALKGAEDLFKESSPLMRRVRNGALRGELGHPRFQSGMSRDEWLDRVHDLYEPNFCAHFKDIWLDDDYIKVNGRKVVAIMANVIPSGAKKAALEDVLKNPNENTAFSIRGITEDFYERGETVRVLKTVVTFDLVNEGGISIAEKLNSPSLETLIEEPFQAKELEHALERRQKLGLAHESSTLLMNESLSALQPRQIVTCETPRHLLW